MSRTRRQHSAEFKSKVALEALKEHKTLAQLTEQYALHTNQISEWKKTLQEGSASLFERGHTRPEAVDLEALRAPYLHNPAQTGSSSILVKVTQSGIKFVFEAV